MTPETKLKLSSAFAEAYDNAENEIEKGIILRQADEWGLTVRTRSIYDDLADYFNLKK